MPEIIINYEEPEIEESILHMQLRAEGIVVDVQKDAGFWTVRSPQEPSIHFTDREWLPAITYARKQLIVAAHRAAGRHAGGYEALMAFHRRGMDDTTTETTAAIEVNDEG